MGVANATDDDDVDDDDVDDDDVDDDDLCDDDEDAPAARLALGAAAGAADAGVVVSRRPRRTSSGRQSAS